MPRAGCRLFDGISQAMITTRERITGSAQGVYSKAPLAYDRHQCHLGFGATIARVGGGRSLVYSMKSILRFEKQYGNINQVPHLVRRAPVEQITDESVSMRGHGD